MILSVRSTQSGKNGINIKHAAAPGSTAGVLKRSPQPCVLRKIGIGSQVRPDWTLPQKACPLLGLKSSFALAHQIIGYTTLAATTAGFLVFTFP